MSDPYDDFGGRDEVRSRITWLALRRWFPLVILVAALAGAAGWYWANSSDPTYTARAVLELTDDRSGSTTRFVDQQEMAAQRQKLLSNDTRQSLDEVLGDDASAVVGVSASIDDDTTLITVEVEATTPATAVTATNALIDAYTAQRLSDQVADFQAELQVVQGQIAEQQLTVDEITSDLANAANGSERRALEISQQAAVNTLQGFLGSAQALESEIALADGRVFVQDRPASATENGRNALFTAAQFGVLGLLLSGGAVVALGSRNSKIRLVDELEELLPPGIPVLATVPRFRKQFRERQNAIVIGRSDAMREAEAFRFVRTAVELATADHPTHTVAVTSSTPAEGKTVTSANLALSLAASGSKTLLVDGDLISPSLPELSGRPNAVNALPHLMTGAYRLDELVTSLGGGDRSLDLLISAQVARTDGVRIELVPESMRQMFKELNSYYQALVIDCPPALVVSDAIATCAAADFTIVVARVGHVRRKELQRTIEVLLQNGATVLGVIATHTDGQDGYGYDDYGYGE